MTGASTQKSQKKIAKFIEASILLSNSVILFQIFPRVFRPNVRCCDWPMLSRTGISKNDFPLPILSYEARILALKAMSRCNLSMLTPLFSMQVFYGFRLSR